MELNIDLFDGCKPVHPARREAQRYAGVSGKFCNDVRWAGLLHHEMLHRVEKSALFGRAISFTDVVGARLWWVGTTARFPPSQQTKSRRSNRSILNSLGIMRIVSFAGALLPALLLVACASGSAISTHGNDRAAVPKRLAAREYVVPNNEHPADRAERMPVAGQELSAGKSGRSAALAERAHADAPFAEMIALHAKRNGVPLALAHAVVKVESNYNKKARGAAGEVGLMQIKPATARLMGYDGSVQQLFEPQTNIRYGMEYLGGAYRLGDESACGAVLRYNAGHGAKRMNPTSRAYCDEVEAILGAPG